MRYSSRREMGPGMKFFFARIFPFIFVIIGASVTYFGVRNLCRASESAEWPTAPGQIIKSSVESHRSTSGSGSNSRSSTTYHAEILYKYSVDGTQYNGTTVAFGDYGSSDPSHANQIVRKYPEGKSVTIYYMPDDNSQCVLEPGMQGQAWFLPVFGAIFLIAGVGLAVFLPRTVKQHGVLEETDPFDMD